MNSAVIAGIIVSVCFGLVAALMQIRINALRESQKQLKDQNLQVVTHIVTSMQRGSPDPETLLREVLKELCVPNGKPPKELVSLAAYKASFD